MGIREASKRIRYLSSTV